MTDRFTELRDNPRVLQELFPFDEFSAGTMCTLAADALDDYLRTGRIEPVRDTVTGTASITGTMHVATLRTIVLMVTQHRHGSWAVVRGTRAPVAAGQAAELTRTHWFIIFNARGVPYVADPYLHVVESAVTTYAREQELRTFAYHGSWERVEFEATPAPVY